MKQKILIALFTSFSLLSLSGCGGGGSNIDNSPYAEPIGSKPTNSVPKKVNVDIPQALKNDRSSNPSNRLSKLSGLNINISLGYEELKSSIEISESTLNEVKSNLVLLDSMMPDIKNECKDTPINSTCTIPAKTITLTIGTAINAEIKKIDNEFNNVNKPHQLPLGLVLSMGEIKYTKYDSNHTYQYDINIDLKPTFSDLNVNFTKNMQTVKWSDNNSSIYIISDVSNDSGSWNMQLKYNKDNNGTEKMTIIDNFNDNSAIVQSGTFNLQVEKLNDVNNTVKVSSLGTFLDSENYQFTSNGQITKDGGFLVSKVKLGTISEFASKESFDINGNLLSSKYCDTITSSCDINDETTWDSFQLQFDQNSNNDNTQDNSKMLFLNINNGEQLDVGFYYLLPSSVNITDSAPDKVYKNEVAWINVMEDSGNGKIVFGTIDTDNYKEGMDLNQMTLYKENIDDYNSPVIYTKVPDNKKPTFSVTFL